MRKSMGVLFFVSLLFLFAQSAAAIDCGEFTSGGDICYYSRQFPWITLGGPWAFQLKAGNIKLDNSPAGPVQVATLTFAKSGQQNLQTFATDNRMLGSKLTPTIGPIYNLQSGESVDVTFWYSGTCDLQFNCTPDLRPGYEANVSGTIWVNYIALDPAWLRGLAGAQGIFMSRGADGAYDTQAVEHESPPAKAWKFPMEETFDKSGSWQGKVDSSIAVANPGPLSLTFSVTLGDQKGMLVAQKSYFLAPRETKAFVFWEEFGSAMFPGGKDFTGWTTVECTGPVDFNGNVLGQITVVALQKKGGAFGNLYVQAVKP